MYQKDNPIIKKRFEEKMRRLDKTSLSILISWAINNATNFLPEELKGTKKGFIQIQKWYPEFINEYRSWMLENMPVETTQPQKLTAQDFIQAKVDAPASQALQEQSEELGKDKINQELEKVAQTLPDEGEFPIINE